MTDTSSQFSGVATRYATALFDLALEAGAVDSVETDLGALEALLEESPDLMRLVRSPAFSADDQGQAMKALLKKAGIGGLVANFIGLIARNRRLFSLPDMIRAFRAVASAHRGEVTADVTSAEPLKDDQRSSLVETLASKLGQTVRINEIVDPAILGGLIVRVGSRMIDTSLRTKLNSMKIAMKEVG